MRLAVTVCACVCLRLYLCLDTYASVSIAAWPCVGAIAFALHVRAYWRVPHQDASVPRAEGGAVQGREGVCRLREDRYREHLLPALALAPALTHTSPAVT